MSADFVVGFLLGAWVGRIVLRIVWRGVHRVGRFLYEIHQEVKAERRVRLGEGK